MRTKVRIAARRTFRALAVRNYRIYFIGQVISVSGTWMQTVAQGWLVLSLTGSGVDLGIVTALQFLPMLLFGSWGGLVADRMEKRRLLFLTQGAAMCLALTLAVLTLSGTIELWQVYLLASLLGVVNLFDNPARQTFVSELVGIDRVPNAVALNSVVMNSARVIGPAIGAVLIAVIGHGDTGIALCFLINAASYLAVIVALSLMRTSELQRIEPVPRGKGQVREGLRYVRSQRGILYPLLAVAVIGIFAFNFTVTLALLAKFTFHAGAGTYGAFTAAMGAGAVIGGLSAAHRSNPSARTLGLIGMCFAVCILAVALAPTAGAAVAFLVPMGATAIAFVATANGTLQLASDPSMRGRVMALYAIGFLGSTPIGAPLVGAISTASSPRVALLVGAVATAAASVPLYAAFGSLGSPSTRSPTMLRWISAEPPQMVSEREKKNEAWSSSTG
jgi:MFS family permease